MEMKKVYEDETVLVIDKPAGWVVTTEGVKTGVTVEDWVKANYAQNKKLARGGVVHRLDKGTSGLLLIAKTEGSLSDLKDQFKKREIEKRYLALVGGDLPFEGDIRVPIKRSNFGFGRFTVDPEGKMAVTEFKVIKKYKLGGKIYSLAEVNLKSGRTHQIRVHFSYLKWPLAGDKTYSGEVIFSLKRPFLHAWKLKFREPGGKRIINLESPLPIDLSGMLEMMDEI